MTAAITGFLTGFSLILAIGAQNAFVLRQGLLRNHVFPLVLFCALSDALLIVAGVLGFGALVSAVPMLPVLMAVMGAVFLMTYGVLRFVAALKGQYEMELTGRARSLKATLAIAAAFTWLNPHVYLDTLGLIGAISTSFEDWNARILFGLGAVSASFVFFFSLGYGARLLAPIMTRPSSWRVLDIGIGLTMWMIAVGLVHGVWSGSIS
ncbi:MULTISPECIES: LysE/ArgO family amino acid transporter [unclassified Aliiroseovarius]|uniref:LysE/ArgO family amino acid transporter n=1 Tax=unclassified Aliiroseovarius TaxID=2623558 RepID=UPI0015686D8D|nr:MULTISPECIES: LysE/ArgO family amino acid transporter [unclassified Aliiroseovarius]NRP11885.1 Arginine exporter protein ArgO [Aliiroseovarius sp. xm-d-517]NRP31668.1 Arginine exporter protein ArgO [Aliiroseovarius sp. xm-m-314]NRP42211.1 Arginine exporter protein ArgO [Aliiroseovarius sp. xm-m-339-2]NRP45643.1 Arginine exporter protein ArgO [Aliiroseovarius sp. xm-m-378]NRP63218.1 Arginine exporter protein ArgO [Aliiroseovarius sp. xm-a-151]